MYLHPEEPVMSDLTELLERVGGTALQIVVGMLVIVVLISVMDPHTRKRKDDRDDHKGPPGGL